MLTVACVWVKANVPYTAEYVVRLRNMVKRHLPIPHRFLCITNVAKQLPDDIETSFITHVPSVPGWWAKIKLFDPKVIGTKGQVLYIDLDTVVVNDLSDLVNPARVNCRELTLLPTEGNFAGRGHLKVVKKYNSSVMSYCAGRCTNLYENWNWLTANRLWGDQDWIAEQRPDLATMPIEWFPRLSSVGMLGPAPSAKVVLCKVPKNHVAAEKLSWVKQAWV